MESETLTLTDIQKTEAFESRSGLILNQANPSMGCWQWRWKLAATIQNLMLTAWRQYAILLVLEEHTSQKG